MVNSHDAIGRMGHTFVMDFIIRQSMDPACHLARLPAPGRQAIQLLMLDLTRISSPMSCQRGKSRAPYWLVSLGGVVEAGTRLEAVTGHVGMGVTALSVSVNWFPPFNTEICFSTELSCIKFCRHIYK